MNKRHEETFTEEDIQIANKDIKRCSSSLALKKMQIKTTLKCHTHLPEWLNQNSNTTKC